MCNFTESNTPPWLFFTFFELHKWYQIAQHTKYQHGLINGTSGSRGEAKILFWESKSSNGLILKALFHKRLFLECYFTENNNFSWKIKEKLRKVWSTVLKLLNFQSLIACFRDRLQISLLILGEFKRINELLFSLKSLENLWFQLHLTSIFAKLTSLAQ